MSLGRRVRARARASVHMRQSGSVDHVPDWGASGTTGGGVRVGQVSLGLGAWDRSLDWGRGPVKDWPMERGSETGNDVHMDCTVLYCGMQATVGGAERRVRRSEPG
jgi:hypothetical protein